MILYHDICKFFDLKRFIQKCVCLHWKLTNYILIRINLSYLDTNNSTMDNFFSGVHGVGALTFCVAADNRR